MGYSWAITADVTVPKERVAELRAHETQPGDLRNAPPGWGRANERSAMTVASLIDGLLHEDLLEVTWRDDAIRACGVVSNDSSTWADLRNHFVAAVRAARVAGGRGEIAITAWVDATPGTAFLAMAAEGGSSFRALRGDDARALEERVQRARFGRAARRARARAFAIFTSPQRCSAWRSSYSPRKKG